MDGCLITSSDCVLEGLGLGGFLQELQVASCKRISISISISISMECFRERL
jgi:hypothetical protein